MKNKSEIKKFLKEKPSYLKKGPEFLASLLSSDNKICKEALEEARKENRMDNKLNNVKLSFLVDFETVTNEQTEQKITKAAIQHFLDKGDYDEVENIVKQLKVKKAEYKTSPIKEGVYIVLGCLHFPFHNRWMWEQVLNIVRDEKDLVGIILAGDILDMHSISRHAKGKITLPDYDLAQEYLEANIALDELDEAIGDRNISKEYFYGNHEDWYNQWGSSVDNWKLGEAGAISPFDACFKHRGYNCQFNWKTAKVQVGDYKIIHGEWTNIHAAHKHATSLHESVIFFHTHRFNTYYEQSIEGLNCGWGGDKNMRAFNYMSPSQKAKWRNGFAKIQVTNQGAFATPLPFINNKFSYNGKIYGK